MPQPAANYLYFADPAQYSTWSATACHCDLCGETAPGYAGPFDGDETTIEFVCEDCLIAGELTEEGGVLHQADLESLRAQVESANPHLPAETVAAIVEDRFSELAEETPPIQGLPSALLWPVHCADFCRFARLTPTGDGGIAYDFDCLECGESLTIVL